MESTSERTAPPGNSAACLPGIYFKIMLARSSAFVAAVFNKIFSGHAAYRGGIDILPFASALPTAGYTYNTCFASPLASHLFLSHAYGTQTYGNEEAKSQRGPPFPDGAAELRALVRSQSIGVTHYVDSIGSRSNVARATCILQSRDYPPTEFHGNKNIPRLSGGQLATRW